MRAVALDSSGEPRLAEMAEPVPEPGGELVRIRACGLCGSDVEKIGRAAPGTVLGHEVAAETRDGRRVALIHHLPCGDCARCRAGHESTCDEFRRATITPGGFAERALAAGWLDLPDEVDDARATFAEPLACVLRGAERVPRGRVLVVGHGFIGRLFAAVLRRRGDDVFVRDADPGRTGRGPDGPVDAAVVCARGGADEALGDLDPGGVLLVFASAGSLDLDRVYRNELQVVGARSATPRHMEHAIALLARLELPEPMLLPLDRFAEGLDLYRSRRALKVVFTP